MKTSADRHFIIHNRLRFYSLAMREKLMRHKHIILVFLLLSTPAGIGAFHAILRTLRSPIDLLIHGAASYFIELGLLFFLQTGFILWTVMQKHELYGEPFNTYCHSLPISTHTLNRANVITAFLGNNILWVPFLLELIFIFSQQYHTELAAQSLSVILIALSCFLASLSIMQKSLLVYLSLSVLNIPLSYALIINTNRATPYLLFSFITLLGLLFFSLDLKKSTMSMPLKCFSSKFCHALRCKLLLNLPTLTLNFIIIIRQYPISLACRLFASLAIAFFSAVILRKAALLTQYTLQSEFISTHLFVLIFSGFSCLLLEAHSQHKGLFEHLPLSKLKLTFSTYMTGLTFTLTCCLVSLVINHLLSRPIINLGLLIFSAALLQWVLHVTQKRYARFGTILSVIITAIWISIALITYPT